jgi:hypothetical protein
MSLEPPRLPYRAEVRSAKWHVVPVQAGTNRLWNMGPRYRVPPTRASRDAPRGDHSTAKHSHPSIRGDSERQTHDNSCNSPPTGISVAVLFVVITKSKRSALRCHCPATRGVFVTFFTGWPVHFTGPTIDL